MREGYVDEGARSAVPSCSLWLTPLELAAISFFLGGSTPSPAPKTNCFGQGKQITHTPWRWLSFPFCGTLEEYPVSYDGWGGRKSAESTLLGWRS